MRHGRYERYGGRRGGCAARRGREAATRRLPGAAERTSRGRCDEERATESWARPCGLSPQAGPRCVRRGRGREGTAPVTVATWNEGGAGGACRAASLAGRRTHASRRAASPSPSPCTCRGAVPTARPRPRTRSRRATRAGQAAVVPAALVTHLAMRPWRFLRPVCGRPLHRRWQESSRRQQLRRCARSDTSSRPLGFPSSRRAHPLPLQYIPALPSPVPTFLPVWLRAHRVDLVTMHCLYSCLSAWLPARLPPPRCMSPAAQARCHCTCTCAFQCSTPTRLARAALLHCGLHGMRDAARSRGTAPAPDTNST